jgi:hypothetical protein
MQLSLLNMVHYLPLPENGLEPKEFHLDFIKLKKD